MLFRRNRKMRNTCNTVKLVEASSHQDLTTVNSVKGNVSARATSFVFIKLKGLPCLVLVVDHGRYMGDSYPTFLVWIYTGGGVARGWKDGLIDQVTIAMI